MRPGLHIVGCFAVLPYSALAGFFVLIDRAATTNGLLSLLDLMVALFLASISWAGLLCVLLWALMLALGLVPATHRIGAALLSGLALVSLLCIVWVPPAPPDLGQAVLLCPCAAIAVASAWSAVSPLSSGPPGKAA